VDDQLERRGPAASLCGYLLSWDELGSVAVPDMTDPLMGIMCHNRKLPCGNGCLPRRTVSLLKAESDRLYCERYLGDQGQCNARVLQERA
jgi:hypothetical protein